MDLLTGQTIVMPSRLELCGRSMIKAENGVGISFSESRGRAGWGNVMHCGLIWLCAVCSARIREGRAQEIDEAVQELRRRGGDAVMLTLTIPHRRQQKLATLLDAVSTGFRQAILNTSVYRGRKVAGNMVGGERQEFGVLGTIRALEITYGDNGWHPHLHVLLLTDRPLLEWERESLRARWYARWNRWAVKAGLGQVHAEHGVKVTGGWAAYVAKVQEEPTGNPRDLPPLPGREMSRMDSKESKGIMPFQLLSYASGRATGERDPRAYALWDEYTHAVDGRQAITWSAGLKGMLLVEDVDDQDLADLDEGGAAGDADDRVWVAKISANSWREHLARNTRAKLEMLDALEQGGPLRLYALLSAWGVEWFMGQDVPRDWLDGPWDDG